MRRLFTFISGLSLLLCIAAMCFWVRTSSEPFQWEWVSTRGLEDPAWQHGELMVGLGRVGYVASWPEANCTQRYFKPSRRFLTMTPARFSTYVYQYDPWTTGSLSRPALKETNHWWHGIQYVRLTDTLNRVTLRQMWLPFWLIASALILLPLVWAIIRLRAWRRGRLGRCPSCGYNLTGNISGVCPECGATFKASQTQQSVQPLTR